jgi:hypothetical protein
MLENTFCHIPRISPRREVRLWESGIQHWRQVSDATALPFARVALDELRRSIDESYRQLNTGNPQYFAGTLPSALHWRLFPEFRHSIAYLDIETTGLAPPQDKITTIALYDGRRILHYVAGQNLDQFARDIQSYRVLVTYNGKCFDVPFIEKSLGIQLEQAHLDLRYILRSLGYKGGLKGCEKQMGIVRPGLEDVDGYFAVLLWQEYQRRRNEKALETLLCYNIHDVVNLESLLVLAYNLKIKASPFERTHRLSPPITPEIPFRADTELIESIRQRYGLHERFDRKQEQRT